MIIQTAKFTYYIHLATPHLRRNTMAYCLKKAYTVYVKHRDYGLHVSLLSLYHKVGNNSRRTHACFLSLSMATNATLVSMSTISPSSPLLYPLCKPSKTHSNHASQCMISAPSNIYWAGTSSETVHSVRCLSTKPNIQARSYGDSGWSLAIPYEFRYQRILALLENLTSILQMMHLSLLLTKRATEP